MNVKDIFILRSDDKEKDMKEQFLINNEDLFIKILEYLEYWQEKQANEHDIIFFLRIIGYSIKSKDYKQK